MSELLSFILDSEDAFKSKARLTSLYSDFARLKNANPEGYRANIAAWSSAFARASRAGLTPSSNTLSIHAGDQLITDLESKGLGRPAAMDAVFAEATSNGDMIPLQAFLHSPSSIYRKPGWLPRVRIPTAWEVMQWSLRQIGFSSPSTLTDGEFVVKSNVEAASQAVLKRLSSSCATGTPSTNVYSLETFASNFSDALSSSHRLSDTDLQILLEHLSRDLGACTISAPTPNSDTTTTTIKFRPPKSTLAPSPITQQDTTIAHLSTIQLNLSTSISHLESRLTTLTTELQPLVSKSSANSTAHSTALFLLRRRKTLTSTLTKRQANLTQVEGVISSIDDAATNAEIVASMKESSAVLKQLNEQVGDVEGVDAVMEGVREERERVEEIVSTVNQEGREGVDEGEVEEELETLMEQERPKKQEERPAMESPIECGAIAKSSTEKAQRPQDEQTIGLPDVPTSEPGALEVPIRERVREAIEEDYMEKRLSLMSLDEDPKTTGQNNDQENDKTTESDQQDTQGQHQDMSEKV